MDERDGMSPGFKFNDWEMRGVPLRLELGPKDVAKGSVVLARRDRPGKEGKSFVPQQGLRPPFALARRDSEGTLRPRSRVPQSAYRRACRLWRIQEGVETGFAFPWWCGSAECEAKIKGRDQGHDALHSSRTAGRVWPVYSLRKGFPRKRHLRSSVLTSLTAA